MSLSYLEFNTEKLNNLNNKLETNLNEIAKHVNLYEKWSKDKFLDLEINKSFVRGILRNSYPSKQIINEVISIFKTTSYYNKDMKWFSRIYPMIHLQGDESEAVGYHYDKIGKDKFFTLWSPITNYNYPALSYVKYSEKLPKFISSLLCKLNLPNLFGLDIKVNKGDLFIWNGNLIHKGNKNTTNKLSSAFQLKITQNKFKHEDSFDINKIDEEYTEKEFKINDLKEIYSYYYQLINFSNNIFNDYKDASKQIADFISANSLFNSSEISFALSVLAQRILTMKMTSKSAAKYSNQIFNLDLMSILTGAENLSSLDRLKSKKNFILDIIKENDPFEILKKKQPLINNYFN